MIRQPRLRSARPKAISPRSCCSRGAQASSACGPEPSPQPRREPEEPAPDDVAREVLLRDAGLAAPPSLAELVQVRKHDLGEHRVEAERAEQPVEHGVALPSEKLPSASASSRLDCATRSPPAVGPAVLEGAPSSLGGGEAVGQVGLHRAHARDVVVRVEAEASLGAVRVEQAVTLLPGPQEVDARARAPAQLADPQMSASRMHSLYRIWTNI